MSNDSPSIGAADRSFPTPPTPSNELSQASLGSYPDPALVRASEIRSPPAPSATIPSATTAVAEDPVGTADNRPLDPEWITMERIGSFIGLVILATVTFIGAGAGSIAAGPWWPLIMGAWSLLMLLLAARAWFWPKVAYRHRSYRLDHRGLVIQRGVFWRSVAHVARSRVQHTDVSQGPLERYFELGTLTVHTAGTQFAAVALDGLSHREAERIRDILIEAGEGDGV